MMQCISNTNHSAVSPVRLFLLVLIVVSLFIDVQNTNNNGKCMAHSMRLKPGQEEILQLQTVSQASTLLFFCFLKTHTHTHTHTQKISK